MKTRPRRITLPSSTPNTTMTRASCATRIAAIRLLYTDGVTEALNGEGEEFGEERLLEAARRHRELSLPEMLETVTDQARRFSPYEQADDITVIVAKCT